MPVKVTKKQRSALKEITKIDKERRTDLILGIGSIGVMVVLIYLYNLFTYDLGIIDMNNTVLRAILYAIAMVIAGFAGIKIMRSSQKSRKIDGLRQSVGISRETLEAWKKGDVE